MDPRRPPPHRSTPLLPSQIPPFQQPRNYVGYHNPWYFTPRLPFNVPPPAFNLNPIQNFHYNVQRSIAFEQNVRFYQQMLRYHNPMNQRPTMVEIKEEDSVEKLATEQIAAGNVASASDETIQDLPVDQKMPIPLATSTPARMEDSFIDVVTLSADTSKDMDATKPYLMEDTKVNEEDDFDDSPGLPSILRLSYIEEMLKNLANKTPSEDKKEELNAKQLENPVNLWRHQYVVGENHTHPEVADFAHLDRHFKRENSRKREYKHNRPVGKKDPKKPRHLK